MTRLEKVRDLIDGAECSSRKKKTLLRVYRESQLNPPDSLLVSLLAMPLGKALKMGLVQPVLDRDPCIQSEEQELSDAVDLVLRCLSPGEERIIRAIFFDDKSPKEIAEELGMELVRVKNIRDKALRQLRSPERASILNVFLK